MSTVASHSIFVALWLCGPVALGSPSSIPQGYEGASYGLTNFKIFNEIQVRRAWLMVWLIDPGSVLH